MALHAKTRQLARSGGVRTRRPFVSMPRPPHPRQTNPHRRNRSLGARSQCQTHQGQLALHNPKRPYQTQTPIPVNLITWEFPRLCRGGSRSLTYTAVVLRKTCDGLRHDVIPAGQQGKASTAEIGDAVGETQSDAFIRDHFSWISSRGADIIMGLLGVSVIGTGEMS